MGRISPDFFTNSTSSHPISPAKHPGSYHHDQLASLLYRSQQSPSSGFATSARHPWLWLQPTAPPSLHAASRRLPSVPTWRSALTRALYHSPCALHPSVRNLTKPYFSRACIVNDIMLSLTLPKAWAAVLSVERLLWIITSIRNNECHVTEKTALCNYFHQLNIPDCSKYVYDQAYQAMMQCWVHFPLNAFPHLDTLLWYYHRIKLHAPTAPAPSPRRAGHQQPASAWLPLRLSLQSAHCCSRLQGLFMACQFTGCRQK